MRIHTPQDLARELGNMLKQPDVGGMCAVLDRSEALALYTYLNETAHLRIERVALQGENEELRHELHKIEEMYLEVTRDEPALTPTGSALGAVDALHRRIDSVVETIGTSIERLMSRVDGLEGLAITHAGHLDDLEGRQEQDDLDRATAEGMAEPAERGLPTFEEALRRGQLEADDRADQYIDGGFSDPASDIGKTVVGETPPRLRVAINLGKDYGVGDWVKVGPCHSIGGHRDISAGWYPVRGVLPADGGHVLTSQVQLDLSQTPLAHLVWIADRNVIDASPTRPVSA